MEKKKSIVVVIDDEFMVRSQIIEVMKELKDKVLLFCFSPDDSMTIPRSAEIFFVDYDMRCTKGPEVVRKLRRTHPNAVIIGWGITTTKDPESRDQKLEFFEAGANRIIDKYIESVPKVVSFIIRPRPERMPTFGTGNVPYERP
jgi:CheY-like chemotaxis protein